MRAEVVHDEKGRFRIYFPYDPELVEVVRGLAGRTWHPDGKYWSIPEEAIRSAGEALREHGFQLDEHALALLATSAPQVGSATETQDEVSNYTVSRLNREVRLAVKRAFPQAVWLIGEVSGFREPARGGHRYFKLVEKETPTNNDLAAVDAVLFEADLRGITDALAKAGNPFGIGDEVVVRVRVDVEIYGATGKYQVIIRELDVNYTLGEVARRREQILRQLVREGLGELNRTLPFPDLPLRVGVVTSLDSRARYDVERTLRESGFSFRVVFHDARVQGPRTEVSIIDAMEWFRARASEFDVLVVCRGGGSRTELASFDTLALGRAVARFPIPVMVGIGHQEDRSVLDYVGWSFRTPTACAEDLVRKVADALRRVEALASQLARSARSRVHGAAEDSLAAAERLRKEARRLLQSKKDELRSCRLRAVREPLSMARGAARDNLAAAKRLHREARRLLQSKKDELRSCRLRAARLPSAMATQARAAMATAARRLRTSGRSLALRSTDSTMHCETRLTATARLRVDEARRSILYSQTALLGGSTRILKQENERTESRQRAIQMADPKKVLQKGYAILRLEGGKLVTDETMAPAGTDLYADLRKGSLSLKSRGPRARGQKERDDC